MIEWLIMVIFYMLTKQKKHDLIKYLIIKKKIKNNSNLSFILSWMAFLINITIFNILGAYYTNTPDVTSLYYYVFGHYTIYYYVFGHYTITCSVCTTLLKLKLKNFNFERDSIFSKKELIFYFVEVFCFCLIVCLISASILYNVNCLSTSFKLLILVAPAECCCFYCRIFDEEDLKNKKVFYENMTYLYRFILVNVVVIPFAYLLSLTPLEEIRRFFEREAYFLYELIKEFAPRSSPKLRYILRSLADKLKSFITYFFNSSVMGNFFWRLRLYLSLLFYLFPAYLFFEKNINQNLSFHSISVWAYSKYLEFGVFLRNLEAVCNNLKNFFFKVMILAFYFINILIVIYIFFLI